MRHSMVLFVACLLAPILTRGDTPDSASSTGGAIVHITSAPAGGMVFLDSAFCGITPLTLDSVSAGRHHLRLSGRSPADWFSDTVDDTITVQAGISMRLQYHIPQRLVLLSSPGSAEVFSGDSLLGMTPLFITAESSMQQPLLLKKTGFAETFVQPADSSGAVMIATLTPVWQPQDVHGSAEPEETLTDSAPVYIAGAVAVVAGVGAAYFKIRADRRSGAFAISHDPATRDEMKHFDLLAAVFLVASQAGMVALSVMLLDQ